DDGGRDRGVVRHTHEVAHESAVDLEGVYRKVLEVAQGRVAGAEIVDGEVDPHRAQPMQRRYRLVLPLHQYAFRELQAETSGVESRRLERVAHGHRQRALADLPAGEIDR